MGNLEKALRNPWGQPGWGMKLLIGGGLNLFGSVLGFIPFVGVFLWFILSLFPIGYAYRVLQNSLLGMSEDLPAWENWGSLFGCGFFVFLICLGYGIIPCFFYWLGKSLWYGGGVGAFIGVLCLILGIASGLVAFFLLPMALVLYASHGELLGTAFHWRSIVEKIWLIQKDYFVGWIAALILLLAVHFFRLEVPLIGLIIYSFLIFYISISLAYLFGNISRDIAKEEL